MDSNRLNQGPPDNQVHQYNHKAGRFICHTCNKRFTKPSLLSRHEVVHLPEKLFECTECHTRFSQKSSLRRHCLEQHDTNLKRFQCVKCPLSFAQKSNLVTHDKKVHPLNGLRHSESYACDRCASVYRNKQKLSRHLNLVHINGNKANIAYDKIEEEDDLALTQNVLEQLKSFQKEMHGLAMPILEAEENLAPTNINVSNNQIDIREVPVHQQGNESISDKVKLKDRLNAEGRECYLSVQRKLRKDGCAVYMCEYCSKEFRKSYDYIRHRRVHTRERPYNCTLCEQVFSTKSNLHEHIKIHRLDEEQGILAKHYPCAVCFQAFSSFRLLDKHMSTHAQICKVAYKCKNCEKIFNSSNALAYHKHKLVDADSEFLHQLLPTPTEVYATATGTEHNCEITEASSAVCIPENTITAQRLKKKRVASIWKCISCERLFSNSANLRDHRRIYHGTYNRKRRITALAVIRCFKCSYCTCVFETKARCKAHMFTHLTRLLNADKFVHSMDKSDVVNALAFVTWETNPASVKVVEFKVMTKNRQRTRNEKNRSQNGAKNALSNHSCHICEYQFRKQSDLKRHFVVHTGERLHKCITCRKSFSLNSTLQQHMLTHAAERTKHICIVCAKTYLTKKALNVHLRLHTGVQPFKCEHCELEFRTSGQRICHLKVKHGITKSSHKKDKNL